MQIANDKWNARHCSKIFMRRMSCQTECGLWHKGYSDRDIALVCANRMGPPHITHAHTRKFVHWSAGKYVNNVKSLFEMYYIELLCVAAFRMMVKPNEKGTQATLHTPIPPRRSNNVELAIRMFLCMSSLICGYEELGHSRSIYSFMTFTTAKYE